jgi:hypothetical protein
MRSVGSIVHASTGPTDVYRCDDCREIVSVQPKPLQHGNPTDPATLEKIAKLIGQVPDDLEP